MLLIFSYFPLFCALNFVVFFSKTFLYHRANITNLAFKTVSRTLYKSRQQAYPRSPTNVAEINNIFRDNEHVRKTFGLTKRDDESKQTEFFKAAIEGKNYSACIFASEDIIQSIQSTSTIDGRLLYADGTFSITPIGIFKQVLILFADIYTYVSLFMDFFEEIVSHLFFLFIFFLLTCMIRWCRSHGFSCRINSKIRIQMCSNLSTIM